MARVRIERAEVREGLLEVVGSVDGVREVVVLDAAEFKRKPRGEWSRSAAEALAAVASQRKSGRARRPASESLPITGEQTVN